MLRCGISRLTPTVHSSTGRTLTCIWAGTSSCKRSTLPNFAKPKRAAPASTVAMGLPSARSARRPVFANRRWTGSRIASSAASSGGEPSHDCRDHRSGKGSRPRPELLHGEADTGECRRQELNRVTPRQSRRNGSRRSSRRWSSTAPWTAHSWRRGWAICPRLAVMSLSFRSSLRMTHALATVHGPFLITS